MLHYSEPLSGQEIVARVSDIWICGGNNEEESWTEGQNIWPSGDDWWSR